MLPRLSRSKFVIAGLATSIIIYGLIQHFGLLKRKSPNTQVLEVQSIHIPVGFTVEKAAGSELVAYPMLGTLDDRGRLFLCESSGKNVTTEEMKSNPEFRIRRHYR